MSAEGRVLVHLERSGTCRARVEFVPPADIGAMLVGRSPQQALNIVRAVYSLCGVAQSNACVTAIRAALGAEPAATTLAARNVLTLAETLREHLMRIVLDWPRLSGRDIDAKPFRPLFDLVDGLVANIEGDPFAFDADCAADAPACLAAIAEMEELLSKMIFCEPLNDWLSRRGKDELFFWAENAGSGAGDVIAYLGRSGRFFGNADALRMLPTNAGALMDVWNRCERLEMELGSENDVPETGVFARRAKDPLIASVGTVTLGVRLVSRLVEMARLPGEMRAAILGSGTVREGGFSSAGQGFAMIEAARGTLFHCAGVEDGRIADYRIMAPTQWNFHPRGIAARCLNRIGDKSRQELEAQAHLAVQAIDPCVGYEVRVH